MTARLPAGETEAHFDLCMDVWQQWMRTGDSHRLGPRSRDSVCGKSLTNYMVTEEDGSASADEGERRYISAIGQAVDACLESLFNFEQNAVMLEYGLARVWNYPQYVQADCLRTGMKRLRELIRKRC